MSDIQCNIDLKKHLDELGLYEPGMTVSDMKAVYNTVKKSKESADKENDFRELMSQTDENCENIHNLRQNSHKNSDNTLIDVYQANTVVSEGNHAEQVNCSMKADAFDKESNITENNLCTKSTLLDTSKRNNICKYNNGMDVFIPVTSAYKPPELRFPSKSNIVSSIFYHPVILKLPIEKRAKVIFQSNIIKIEKYVKVRSEVADRVPWCDTIKPNKNKTFNGDLHIDAKPSKEEQELNLNVDNGQAKDIINVDKEQLMEKLHNASPKVVRTKRQVKRKNYNELDSSDETDFVVKNNKKTKANNGTVERRSKIQSSENIGNIIPKNNSKPTSSSPLLMTEMSNHTSRIFDELKKQNIKKGKQQTLTSKQVQTNITESSDEDMFFTDDVDENNKILKINPAKKEKMQNITSTNQESRNRNDTSDDEIFPKVKITVDVHERSKAKSTNQDNCQLGLNQENLDIKTQQGACRKQNTSDTDIVLEKLNSTRVASAKNFYGTKSRRKETDTINNNEGMTECPICQTLFPLSVIEDHAATCVQFMEEPSEPKCVICEKRIPLSIDMCLHRQQCLNAICEQSDVTTKCDRNDNKVGGHLCSICDTYIPGNIDISKHASECISSIKRK